jgi:hypothetical protein
MTAHYGPSVPAQRALAAWRIASSGGFMLLDRPALIRRQRGRCYLCTTPLANATIPKKLRAMSRDHVFPKSRGAGTAANYLLAHMGCNSRKSDRWPYPCEVIFLAAIYAEPARPRR